MMRHDSWPCLTVPLRKGCVVSEADDASCLCLTDGEGHGVMRGNEGQNMIPGCLRTLQSTEGSRSPA